MNRQYEAIHEYNLCMLHQLAFGQLGLKGDANERLLRQWYEMHKGNVESAIYRDVHGAPSSVCIASGNGVE